MKILLISVGIALALQSTQADPPTTATLGPTDSSTPTASVNSPETWTTTDGKVYVGVKVVKVEDDAVTILDSDGGARVPIASLPLDLQKRFNYDPAKAKAAADVRAKEDAAQANAIAAQAEAATQEAARNAEIEQVKRVAEKEKRNILGTVIQVIDLSANTKGYLVALKALLPSSYYFSNIDSGEVILLIGGGTDYVDNDYVSGGKGFIGGEVFDKGIDVYYAGTTNYTSTLGAQKTVRVYSPDEDIAVRVLLKSKN